MATRIQHWDSTTCPYAQRSWIALLEKGLDFEVRKCDLQNKDAEFVALYHSIFPDLSAPAKVPILVDGDVKLVESAVIVDYLNSKYPEPPLLPADPVLAAKARLFVEVFTSQFTPAIFDFFRTETPADVEAATEKLDAALKTLDAFLCLHGREEEGGGSFLLGSTHSLAEVMTAGFVQRAMVALPAFRNVDFETLLAVHPRMQRWVRAALARPSLQQTTPSEEAVVGGMRKFVAPWKG